VVPTPQTGLVSRETLEISNVAEIPGAKAPSRARKIIESGDTIFATIRPSLKRVAQVPDSLHGEVASTAFCILRPNRNVVDPEFLFFVASNDAFADEVAFFETGASYPAVRDSDVLDQEILLPPLPDQRLIAHVLGTARIALLHQSKSLAASEDLKRTAMRELFTRGLRGEPQKETAFGLMPQDWVETTLGAVCENEESCIQTGPFGSQLHAHEYQVPVVNPTHLAGNRINHDSVPRVSDERASTLSRHRLQPGDILFARRGEIGRLGLAGPDEKGWVCGTGCFLVRVHSEGIDNSFLARLFGSVGAVAWLESNAAGAIMPNLNNTVLGRLPVVCPPIDEQREIVAILDAIDRKIEFHKRKRTALEELFKTLLHKLMTGEIRVADLDLSALKPAEKPEAAE
jgi:type I restriction enzyme, S subunit